MKITKEETLVDAYRDYEKLLLKRSFFKISNKELAEDLVQITFLKTWEYLTKFGKIDLMKAFLFHVLNNLIIDEYRKNKSVSLDALTEKGFQIAIDDSDRLFNIMDGKNAILLIPLLTEKYRAVISMHYVDDMSLQEIARATNQLLNQFLNRPTFINKSLRQRIE